MGRSRLVFLQHGCNRFRESYSMDSIALERATAGLELSSKGLKGLVETTGAQ